MYVPVCAWFVVPPISRPRPQSHPDPHPDFFAFSVFLGFLVVGAGMTRGGEGWRGRVIGCYSGCVYENIRMCTYLYVRGSWSHPFPVLDLSPTLTLTPTFLYFLVFLGFLVVGAGMARGGDGWRGRVIGCYSV